MNTINGHEPLFTQTVTESDIDWILNIELNSNDAFRNWLAGTVFGVPPASHEGAWRSVSDRDGESDVVWRFRAADGDYRLVFIENKINAVAQPRQCERYFERGRQHLAKGYCSEVRTILIAPESYHSSDSDYYEQRVSYEDLQEWYETQEDERSKFLASMFKTAIEKSLHTGPQVIDIEVTEFRKRYFGCFQNFFKDLPFCKDEPAGG
jgi:hypothetical protein